VTVVHGLASPASLIEVLGSAGAMQEAALAARSAPVETLRLDSVRRLAPVPVPPSVRDFMAFEEHVVTSNRALGLEVDPSGTSCRCFTSATRPRSSVPTTTCR
jgi:hypothetical protein